MLTPDELDFVVPPGEPRTHEPERRKRVIRAGLDRLRRVFLDGITHQIGLARDPDYQYPRHTYVNRDGDPDSELVYRQPTPWWYEEDGVTYLRLTFGEREHILPHKNPVIRVGEPDNLLPTLEALYIRVSDGELDELIEKMAIVPNG